MNLKTKGRKVSFFVEQTKIELFCKPINDLAEIYNGENGFNDTKKSNIGFGR